MIRFLQRDYPSANSILLPGGVLVDPGCATAVAGLAAWLGGERPSLIVNTHWHSDHSGANHIHQALGVPVAAAAAEAALINAGAPDACRAAWLRQTVPAYRVDRPLHAGDVVADGWVVTALPGHSAEQIGLWHAGQRALVCADALAQTDIGWLDLDADKRALDQAETTVAAIGRLAPSMVLPGHGPLITDVAAALAKAERRLASWRRDPARIAWHACKRIFTHGLMLEGGLDGDAVAPYLVGSPWFVDHARRAFGVAPEVFVPTLLAEMLRSGAARWAGGRLCAYSSPALR